MVTRWTFEDTETSEVYTLEMNPYEGGSPGRKRNVGHEVVTAPDGDVIRYEGLAEPRQWQVRGTCLTQAFYEKLEDWSGRPDPTIVTDDLGRQITVLFSNFEPQRVRSALHPWKHDYTLEATVLSITMP